MKPKIKNYYNKNEIELADIARKLRALAIKSVHSAGSGHLGGSLSAADIISCLYFDEMNLNVLYYPKGTHALSYIQPWLIKDFLIVKNY